MTNLPADKQLDPLAIFGRMVLEEFRGSYSDLDGGWLQDAAVKCGLLTPVEVTPENICRKASDMGQIEDGAYCECEIGDLCYRLTDAAKVVTVDVPEHHCSFTLTCDRKEANACRHAAAGRCYCTCHDIGTDTRPAKP